MGGDVHQSGIFLTKNKCQLILFLDFSMSFHETLCLLVSLHNEKLKQSKSFRLKYVSLFQSRKANPVTSLELLKLNLVSSRAVYVLHIYTPENITHKAGLVPMTH